MAKRYRRMSSILIHRIGSFLKRLLGFKSKEKYLDDEKIKETEESEENVYEAIADANQTSDEEEVVQNDSANESDDEELEEDYVESNEEELEDVGYTNE